MPSILQLPPLDEQRATGAGQPVSNGAGGSPKPALRLGFDSRVHTNAFRLLDESIDLESQRNRLREAFWISVIVHGAALLVLIFALPRLAAHNALPTPLQKMLMEHQLTFLQLPPTPAPKTPSQSDRISDQNRTAELRNPPDQKLLQKLLDSRVAQQAAQHPQPQAPAQRTPATRPAPQQPANQGRTAQPTEMAANGGFHAPAARRQPAPNPFQTPLSPGAALQQALQQTAANHGAGGFAGDVGSLPPPPNTHVTTGPLDVLSDTMGVDFGPYLSRVLDDIRRNWYILIPEEARYPLMKQGKVQIYFEIQKDGSVSALQIATSSNDKALDLAAKGGITGSNPFQPLPKQFKGPKLALLCTFYYNPGHNQLH